MTRFIGLFNGKLVLAFILNFLIAYGMILYIAFYGSADTPDKTKALCALVILAS